MGIKFYCPNGHKLNVKAFQAGRRGICPFCGTSVEIPTESTRGRSKSRDLNPQSREIPEGVSTSDTTVPDQTPDAPRASTAQQQQQQPSRSQPVEPTPTGPPGFETPSQAPVVEQQVEQQEDAGGDDDEPSTMFTPADSPKPTTAAPIPQPASEAPSAPEPPPRAGGPADPLSEAPEAVWYVRPGSGGQFGPASGAIMRTWLDEGRVSADSLVWREGWRDWQDAVETFPELAAGQTPAPTDIVADPPWGKAAHGGGPRSDRSAGSNRKGAWIVAGLLFAVVALVVVLYFVLKGKPDWMGRAVPSGDVAVASAGDNSSIETTRLPSPRL